MVLDENNTAKRVLPMVVFQVGTGDHWNYFIILELFCYFWNFVIHLACLQFLVNQNDLSFVAISVCIPLSLYQYFNEMQKLCNSLQGVDHATSYILTLRISAPSTICI